MFSGAVSKTGQIYCIKSGQGLMAVPLGSTKGRTCMVDIGYLISTMATGVPLSVLLRGLVQPAAV